MAAHKKKRSNSKLKIRDFFFNAPLIFVFTFYASFCEQQINGFGYAQEAVSVLAHPCCSHHHVAHTTSLILGMKVTSTCHLRNKTKEAACGHWAFDNKTSDQGSYRKQGHSRKLPVTLGEDGR